MPRVIKKKISKKQGGSEFDVKDRLSEIRSGLQKRQRIVLSVSIAAIALILAVSGFFLYRHTESQESRKLENEAYRFYHNEFQKSPLSDKERFQKALDLFTKAYFKNKSARLLVYIAATDYELARYHDAITSLNLVINKYSEDRDVLPLAYQLLAKVQLKMGSKGTALQVLDALYKTPGDIFKDYALIESARILESEGKKEEAAKKYKELTEKFTTSPFFEEAKSKLGDQEKS